MFIQSLESACKFMKVISWGNSSLHNILWLITWTFEMATICIFEMYWYKYWRIK